MRHRCIYILLSISLFFIGCGSESNSNETSTKRDTGRETSPGNDTSSENDSTETSGAPKTCRTVSSEATVEKKIQSLGASANQIVRSEDFLWIVESGDNVVSRYNVSDNSYRSGFIDLGAGKNPYSIAVSTDTRRVFVTNYADNSVTVADYDTGEIVQTINADSFSNPSGIALTERAIYVSNVNFNSGRFGEGSVTIINRQSFSPFGSLKTHRKNPQFLESIQLNGSPHIIISETGSQEFGEEGVTGVSEGAIEIWKETQQGQPERTKLLIKDLENKPKVGGPGQIAVTPDKKAAYVASGTAPVMFKVNLETKKLVRGVEDPIQMYQTGGGALDSIDIGANGILALTAFNEDKLYLYDTGCDQKIGEPFDLSTSQQLAGAQDVAIFSNSEGYQAYFIMGLANRLGRVNLTFSGGSQ